jgi:hypothetical protein
MLKMDIILKQSQRQAMFSPIIMYSAFAENGRMSLFAAISGKGVPEPYNRQ